MRLKESCMKEMIKLKGLSEKMENLDESIFEVKGIISDSLAAKVA